MKVFNLSFFNANYKKMNYMKTQILNQRQQPMLPMIKPNVQTPMIAKSNGNSDQEEQPKQIQVMGGFEAQLAEFLNVLNQNPDPQQIKVNAFANNSRYLPIEYLESQLDIVFGGLWQLKHVGGVNFMGNSISVDVELRVFHPVAKIWLTRAGSGAVQIQLDQNGFAKPKSVERAVGAALAMAEKNAIKKLGGLFGKYLNRGGDEVAEYYSFMYSSKIVNQ
jgi:hypothetical protein